MQKKVIVLLIVSMLLCVMALMSGCEDKKWWEDRENVAVIVTIEGSKQGTISHTRDKVPLGKAIYEFDYEFDDREVEIKVVIKYKGEERGYATRVLRNKYKESTGRYEPTAWVKTKGQYEVKYDLHSAEIDGFWFGTVSVDINIY